MSRNWTPTCTYENRYNILGVTGYMRDHAKDDTKQMIIVDVGCSNGLALKRAQECLRRHDISAYTIGIDPSLKIKTLAEKNVDEFYNADVLEIDLQEKADVVICANVARFVDGEHKRRIFKKCAQLLKPDGVFVVAAGQYRKFDARTGGNLKRPCALCVGGILGRARAQLDRLVIRDVRVLSKGEAEDFAEHVLSDWNSKHGLNHIVLTCEFRVLAMFSKFCR